MYLGDATVSSKKCPKCGLWNAENALRCDCGYQFKTGETELSDLDLERLNNKQAKMKDPPKENFPFWLFFVAFSIFALIIFLSIFLVFLFM